MKSSEKIRLALVVPNFAWGDWDENTRWRFIPYNLCLLAAMVEDRCVVEIIDANSRNLDDEAFCAAIKEFGPDVVGITVLMDQYSRAGHHGARLVKTCDPGIKVLLGGVYATMNPEAAAADENIDFVVVGEGEYVLQQLVDYFNGRGALPGKGIVFRENGGIGNRGRSDLIVDLDALPMPAYHLIRPESYTETVPVRKSVDSPSAYPYARILTSRGCPYGCVFCQVESIAGRKFRPRSPEKILDEIELLKNRYGIRSVIFDDDNLYTDRKRAAAIFQGMIDRRLDMPWDSISVAAFRLDDELIELMRRSGCEFMNIAVESGNERVLREIVGKPLKHEQAIRVVKKARAEGIFVAANFIIGFPTETWDEIWDTINFAEKLDADYIKIFVAIPLPQTRLWDLCEKTNSFKPGFSRENVRWSTGQIETDQFTPRDLTILRAYEWDRINFSNPDKRRRIAAKMGISEEELLEIRRRTLANARGFVDEI